MSTLDITNNIFNKTFTLTKQNGSKFNFSTGGKYVDKDINLTINVKNATATSNSASANAALFSTDGSAGGINIYSSMGEVTESEPSSGYYVGITASGSGNSKITSAGWINTGTLGTASTTKNKYFVINSAAFTVTASGSLANPLLANSTDSINNKTKINVNPDTNKNNITTDFYITLKATEEARTVTLTKSGLVTGFLGNNNQITANNITLGQKESIYYLPIPKASITLSSPSSASILNLTYTYNSDNSAFDVTGTGDITGTTVATVNTAGWIKDNLSTNITGTASLTNIVTPLIGIKAEMTGTAKVTPTISKTSDGNASSGTATTTKPSSGYYIAVQSAAAANTITASPKVTADGYGTTTYNSKTNTTLSVGANASTVTYIPITSAVGQITSSGTTTTKPVIKRNTFTISNVTDASSGAETTTQPTSGVYVKVNSAANTGTLTVKEKITTAGYAPVTDNLNSTIITVGASASDATYIPIKIGEATTDSASVTKISTDGSNSGINIASVISASTTTEPTSGYYIAFTATGNSKVTKAGWFQIGSLPSTTSEVTYFPITTGSCTIAGGVLSTSGFSKTDLALTLSSGSNTNMANITVGAQDTTNYPYYFKVNGSTPAVSGNTSASVTAITDTHTAGYIPAKSTTNFRNAQSASPTVSVNSTSASTYVSLKKASMTIGGTNSVTASLTSSNATLVTTNNSGISLTGGGSATITATATTNQAGYAPASIQLGSATKTGNNSKTQYLKEVEIIKPSSGIREFGVKVPNGDSTITFVFHVDSTGNVLIDNEYNLTY